MNTFTEENYLKAIYKLSENGNEAISTNELAEKLHTKAASVTDMLKKLSVKKLINYRKYQGFSLSASGRRVAVEVIRKHRLWELFLVEKLHFSWDEVHEVAEQLEHISSSKLVERLDEFLDYPKHDPHGDPIPDVKGKFRASKSSPLSELAKQTKLRITGVIDHTPAFLRYLDKQGISLGDSLVIEERNEYDASLMVKLNNKVRLQLSPQVAQNILATAV